MPANPSRNELSPEALFALDGCCDRFEAAWRAGRPTNIEDLLQEFGEPGRDILLRELLLLEWHYRKRRGDAWSSQEYETRFPDFAGVVAAARDDLQRLPPPSIPQETLDYATNSSDTAPAPLAAIPRFIGKYQIIHKLGEGGQATVYRAVHCDLPDRDVVIKWAREGLPREAQQRLIEEGRVLAGLEMPGLVRVFDVGVHEDRPFVVFQYVAGHSLKDELKTNRPGVRRAVALVADLAATMHQVHRHGVLHRDLKPANVFIDKSGHAKILDFGLSWTVTPWADASLVEDSISGTLVYMAPEQARGDGREIGPWTDVFGLGAILYELLTGRTPHSIDRSQGDHQAQLEKVSAGQIVPPRQIEPQVPRAVERIVMRALATDAAERYRSARELERALRGYLRRRLLVGVCLALVAVCGSLVWAARAGLFARPRPAIPALESELMVRVQPPIPALEGELMVRVWSPKDGGRKRGLKIDENGALPVRNGEHFHVEARLQRPAYLCLLWIDAEGKATSLDLNEAPDTPLAAIGPRQQVHFPPELSKGYEMDGAEGLEMVVLLAREEPLPDDFDLLAFVGVLPTTPLFDPREVAWLEVDSSRKVDVSRGFHHRGLGSKQDIDDPGLVLLQRLREHFDLVKALRFAHVEK